MTPMLEIEDLQLTAGSFQLGPLDLELGEGEYTVLMGATGSGKSLLAKAICGLVSLESGRIRLGGDEVSGLPPGKRGIGYVPQNSALFPHLTVGANLAFSGMVKGRRQKQALEEIGDLIEELNLSSMLERQPLSLSGGERQKVALARALASRPRLLLLDEPVSALDEPTRREVCTLLQRLHRHLGVTTLHICHSLEEARAVSTKVAILDQGKLRCLAPLPDLLQNPPESLAVRRLLHLD